MSIYLIYAWKTRLWAKVIDPWLDFFSEIGLRAYIREAGNIELIEEAEDVVLVKVLDIYPSYPIVLALICFTPLLSYKTFISTYWSSLSNKPIFISSNLI